MIKNYDLNDISYNNTILDFYSNTCGPCKMTGKYLDEFSSEHPEIEIFKVNIDEMPEVAAEYGVISIPTVLCVNNDDIVWRHIGLMTKKQMGEQIL